MNACELFELLAPLVAPLLEEEWGRRDLCVLSTRIAIETAAYFGIQAVPVPVKVILYNADFASHVANNYEGVDRYKVSTWGDNSWSVGIGCGLPNERGRWDGHLIAVADGWFADYAISQAERPQYDLRTGPAVVGPYTPPMWCAMHVSGTVVEYTQTLDDQWRAAPDWKDEKRRRKTVGKLIRAVRAMEVTA